MSSDSFKNKSSKKSSVYVLYTGGTFGMTLKGSKTGGLEPMLLEQLKDELQPERFNLHQKLEIQLDEMQPPIDSSSMTPKNWVDIVKKIEAVYDKHDGFIIIQGTDTLAYTASALSFMFENLAKPVIVTGSQLPIENPRTDGKLNYGHALQIAGYKATDLPCIPEVIVVFADKVLRGCRTRKMSASSWTGFETPNCATLGEIGEHVRIYENQIRPAPPTGFELQTNTDLVEGVLDTSIYPGLTAKHLSSILQIDGIEGVILRTYGTGNAPDNPAFLHALNEGIAKGDKTVVNITQCPQGTVEMGLYAASIGLMENGVISGLDMTPEAALTKLMVTMGSRHGDQIKLQMQINQRGEQTFNLFDLDFSVPKDFVDCPWTELTIPDRRFDPTLLSTSSLRLMGVEFKDEDVSEDSFIDIYMNMPRASSEDSQQPEHPRRVCRIEMADIHNRIVVKELSKEKTRNRIGDSDIVLTLVPSDGLSFKFSKMALSLFTQA